MERNKSSQRCTGRSRPTRTAKPTHPARTVLPSRKPNRLAGFDYSQDGFYFITSSVQDMKCIFGEIIEGNMKCNLYGTIAEEQWAWLQSQYPYIVSHAFVVMPNHVHAIIEISASVPTGRDLSVHDLPVRSHRDLPVPRGDALPQHRKIKSLSELIGAYKTTVSKKIHLSGFTEFRWKRSFHDHIIRDDESFVRIKNYIDTNPSNWKADELAPHEQEAPYG